VRLAHLHLHRQTIHQGWSMSSMRSLRTRSPHVS
jgi:hypothetical protein